MKPVYMISNDWSKRFTTKAEARKALERIEKQDKKYFGKDHKDLEPLCILKVAKV